MKFGTAVLVERGSPGQPVGAPGHLREVRGVLVGRRGHESIVRLTEDDPFATVGYCTKAGDIGHWSSSAVRPVVR